MRALEAPSGGGPTRADAPAFSVLVSAYQSATTIGETLTALLAQTRPAHEIVVCDDGSTDDLDGALAPFSDSIRLIRKANGGGASALNAGAAAAEGEFVVICDSDDVYAPERLEALTELAQARADLDLLATDAFLEREGRVVGRFNRDTPFAADGQRAAILERCFLFAPAIRRTRLLGVGGADPRLRIAYDWDCWMRLIHAGARAGLVDEPLMRYRLRAGSLAGSRVLALRERLAVLEKAGTLPGLTADERVALRAARAYHGRRWGVAAAEAALARPGRPARRVLLEAAGAPGMAPRARARCVATALAPGAWWPRPDERVQGGGRVPGAA